MRLVRIWNKNDGRVQAEDHHAGYRSKPVQVPARPGIWTSRCRFEPLSIVVRYPDRHVPPLPTPHIFHSMMASMRKRPKIRLYLSVLYCTLGRDYTISSWMWHGRSPNLCVRESRSWPRTQNQQWRSME